MQKIPNSTWIPVLAVAQPSHRFHPPSPAQISSALSSDCSALEHTRRHQSSTAWPNRVIGLNWIWVLLQPRKANAEWLTALALRHGPALSKTKEKVSLNALRIRSSPSQSVRKGSVPYSQEQQDVNKWILEKLHPKMLFFLFFFFFFFSETSESNMRFFSSPLNSSNRLYPADSLSEEIIFL